MKKIIMLFSDSFACFAANAQQVKVGADKSYKAMAKK